MADLLRHLEDEELLANFHTLHQDTVGLICVSQYKEGKWSNRYGRYKTMQKHLEKLEQENFNDVFFSQNTFRKFRRTQENLLELTSLYIDLDYYKLGLTEEQVLYGIDFKISEHAIPQPTLVTKSGHGLYLSWKIKRLPGAAFKLWRAMQEYLFVQLKDLGADNASLDASRVLRVIGSINCKYPITQKVKAYSIWQIEYDLHHLQEEFLSYNNSKSKSKHKRRTGKLVYIKNIYTLYCNRRTDILSLCKMRNFELTGMREQVLFLYRYYGCLEWDKEKALEEMEWLNNQFTKPLRASSIERVTRSAEKAAAIERYNYKSSTLIDMLRITQEEMRKTSNGNYVLKTIISREEKYRRHNEKRRSSRRNSQGNTQREQEIQDNLALIKLYKEQGLTQKTIATNLNMSIRNVQKYYKLLRDSH